MSDIIKFFSEHYQWLFDGIGAMAVGFLLNFLFHKNKNKSQNKVHQQNIYAGRDVVGRDKTVNKYDK